MTPENPKHSKPPLPKELPENIDLEDLVIEDLSDLNIGYCLNCGTSMGGVEPDAEYYTCPDCNQCMVFGTQTILIEYGI